MIPERFVLGPSERNSPTWRALEEYFTGRLSDLRAKNDNPGKGEAETAFLRGQIAMAKELLELGKGWNPVAS